MVLGHSLQPRVCRLAVRGRHSTFRGLGLQILHQIEGSDAHDPPRAFESQADHGEESGLGAASLPAACDGERGDRNECARCLGQPFYGDPAIVLRDIVLSEIPLFGCAESGWAGGQWATKTTEKRYRRHDVSRRTDASNSDFCGCKMWPAGKAFPSSFSDTWTRVVHKGRMHRP